jgi:ribosome modulation factor
MTPFMHGYEAGLRGVDPRSCPYEKLSLQWQSWQRGHALGAVYLQYYRGAVK